MSFTEERMSQLVERSAEPIHESAKLIRTKVADAAAHGRSALTLTLDAVPDGKRTIARLRQSRSFIAAVNRLSELTSLLVRHLIDAREEFYRDSWNYAVKTLPENVRRTDDPEAPETSVAKARSLVVFGVKPEEEIQYAVQGSQRNLQAVLTVAASRSVRDKEANDAVSAWETRTINKLVDVTARLIGDSSSRLDYIAVRDVLKPELLEDDPTL